MFRKGSFFGHLATDSGAVSSLIIKGSSVFYQSFFSAIPSVGHDGIQFGEKVTIAF
jgi:hypothetical protein